MRGPPARHHDEAREQLPAPEGLIADASELKPNDRVVYPSQGVCVVVGDEEMEIAGQKQQFVRMAREEDGSAISVPKNKVPSIGLRRVATGAQMEGVFHYLGAVYDDPELDWKVRHRDNADRLIAGGVLGVAEVVKGLHSLSRLRPLPTKEREQYDNARHLLVHEVAVSLGVPPGIAEDYIDYALMPPAGVKFDLKPPPAPVLLPSRPKKRLPVAEEEEGGALADLGLGDLGIDLGALDGALEGEAVAGEEGHGEGEGEREGEEAGEGGAEGAEAAGEEEAPPPPPRPERKPKAPPKERKAAEKKERPAAAAKPAGAKVAEKKAKAPQAKAAKPAKAAAKKGPTKKAAEKPARAAPRRGGKKK
ncbi:CarD family transcriptional regulator [Anaeromyxobacter oryzisoli]|uniref:CarD family transcriptional regulator n=1 Tax=Anaeromyxobacter oryzisoli TaxID=2925408 RepID=UPI001F5961D1|nr:CarD family transcriptional regulator [Anaeromyxobacter sp. SG63]